MTNKILAIDIGKTSGWAFKDEVGLESGHWFAETYTPWAKELYAVLEKYTPDIVVCSQTNSFGHFNATRAMYMRFGIICLICETKELPVVEFTDTSARKHVLGEGRGRMKKKEAQALFVQMFPEHGGKTEDEIDAIILALGWEKINQETV